MDYTGVDVNTLTVDDAMADTGWAHGPWDFVDYIGVDRDLFDDLQELSYDEIAEIFLAVGDYCRTGEMPVMDGFSTACKMAVRSIVRNHKRRMETEYLKRYRQFVRAKQRPDKKS